jgi:transcriptional regulator with XRE-family HTH domain
METKTHGIDAAYIRSRIAELREQKGTTEYQMSLALGRGKSYIQNIMVGRALPSLTEFLKICNFLEVTPKEFFDTVLKNPSLFNKAVEKMRTFDEGGIRALLGIMDMIKVKQCV